MESIRKHTLAQNPNSFESFVDLGCMDNEEFLFKYLVDRKGMKGLHDGGCVAGGRCVAGVWTLCGWCVDAVWLVCGRCVAGVWTLWLMCGRCVDAAWLGCGRCAAGMWTLRGWRVDAA